MKQKWKRIVARILVAVMLLGVIPENAFATEMVAEQETTEEIVTEEQTEEVKEELTTELTTENMTEATTTESTSSESSEEATTEITTEATTEVTPEENVTTETTTEVTTETEIAPSTETEMPALQMASEETVSEKYMIYCDGQWDSGYRWYCFVNGKKHYIFCLNKGKTMYSGRYYGYWKAGYSGKSAFKKAVALNYFYKVNGNSWNGTNHYGDVQRVIWDWTGSDTASALTTYVNHAWALTSLNSSRKSGSDSYSSLLKGIKKSDADTASARKKMIASLSSKNVVDMSDAYNASDNTCKGTIKLSGKAWKYFNNGGYNGGSSDIVVDGIYDTDGNEVKNCSASITDAGYLSVKITTNNSPVKGKTADTAYTVIMHVDFDYKGADNINYLLTEDGKQNLTFDADFNTAAYFAVRVYGDADKEGAKLYINKVDEYDTFVPGCTFRLVGVQGDALKEDPIERTINTSSYYFKVDAPGYYKLTETAVPSSEYKLDTTEHYIYAEYNDDNQLLLYAAAKENGKLFPIYSDNEFYKHIHEGEGTASFKYKYINLFESGSASLTKYGNCLVKYENGKFVYSKRTLANVGFSFYAAEDIYLNETLVIKKGTEILSGMEWGTDSDDLLTDKVHKVEIDGRLYSGDPIPGPLSKYRGYTADGGTMTISDLPPGQYYCVETDLSSWKGLYQATNMFEFEVNGGETTSINDGSIINEEMPADVHVYKYDNDTKTYLGGAEFTLYANINNTNYDGEKLFTSSQTVDVVTSRNLATGKETVEKNTWVPVLTAVSADDGFALFGNIPYGDYLIAETKAPEGYELSEKTIKFTHYLPENASDYTSGFVYEYEFGNIQSSKCTIYKKAEKAYLNTAEEKNVDAYVYKEEAIEGVVFGVYADEEIKNTLGDVVYKQGDLVTTTSTDKDGIASFGGAMFVGKYYFKEIETADDKIYQLDENKYSFEVTGKEKTKKLTDEDIINKQYKGSIKVIKTDGVTKAALADVEFNLLDFTKEKVIGTYVTDVNGELYIKNLPVGTYYLQEVKAKENYKLDDTLHEVTISKENLDQELSFTNEEYKGSIKIIKTDGKTKVALSGVEFKLYDGTKKNILGTYVTDKKGEIFIDNLSVGTYYLQESKTKKGYKLDDEMVEVVISVDDLHKQVEMKNYRSETKITIKTDTTYSGSGNVRTGDAAPLFIIFMLMILSSLGAVVLAKKKGLNFPKLKKISKRKWMLIFAIAGVSAMSVLTVHATIKDISTVELEDVEYNGTIYTYALQKQYETSNQETKITFEEKVDGMNLVDVDYETIETVLQKEILETTKDYKDLLVKDESSIAKTITLDGNVYELQDITWSAEPNIETVRYTVDYGFQTAEPTPDATYEYTYISPVTEKENTAMLPFVRLDKGSEEWVDGFSATVTFHNIDGLYFTLGNNEIAYDVNKLSLTTTDYQELVKMLGFDTSKYRFTNIAWSGGEYKSDGMTCRNAKATGQQYAASYKAIYEDEVENGKIYTAHATYACEVEVPAEEAAPTYIMSATAYYEKAGIMPVVMAVGIVIMVISVVAILYVLTRKKKKVSIDPVYTETQE